MKTIDTGVSLMVAQAKGKVSNISLARSFKVHSHQVQRWRSGKDMKVSLAIKLAAYFNIEVAEFLALGEEDGGH